MIKINKTAEKTYKIQHIHSSNNLRTLITISNKILEVGVNARESNIRNKGGPAKSEKLMLERFCKHIKICLIGKAYK